MPAKILNTFTDENPELHKQIGCMTGILQMFDRHHLLSGRRHKDHNYKKHPSGQALSNSRSYKEAYNSSSPRVSLNENRRVSIDSSRASFSSSSSSSSSSFFDCNKSMQQDADTASFDRTFLQEQSLKGSLNFKAYESDAKSNPCSNGQTTIIQNAQQYHDLRKVVKDSMQRDSKSLPVMKTLKMEEERNQATKQRNSPRLSFLSKATEGICATGTDSKPKVPEVLNESTRVLLKLKQAPLSFSEYATKDSSYQLARQSPRFSWDDREFTRRPIDSRDDSKAIAAKLRDLPRLSLDSREVSLRSSNLVSRASTLMEDLNRTTTTTTTTPRLSKASSLHEDPGSNKRPAGLVAKLMGLEELPNSWNSTAQESINKQINGSFSNSPSTKSARVMKENQISDSPKSSVRDSSAPKAKSCCPPVKQNSRITTEAAPWIQQERGRVVRRAAVGCREAETKRRTASVYSEIVKKLKELEFQQSNKDLRALKQILGAMHPKALLEATKDNEQQPLTPTQGNFRDQNPARKQLSKSCYSPRAYESPIVLVRPAKSVSKSGVPPLYPNGTQSGLSRLRTSGTCDRNKGSGTSKTDKEQSPRVSPRLHNVQLLNSADKQFSRQAGEITVRKPRPEPAQSLSKLQYSMRDDNGSSPANSCAVSPRILQRRAEAEKKHQVESVSPRGKLRLKPAQTQIQKIEEKASESPKATRNSSCQSAISKRPDKNITLTSMVDLDAIRIDRSVEVKSVLRQQGQQSPSSRPVRSVTSLLNQKNSSPIFSEYTTNKEILNSASDQASPVSVLDTSFNQDVLPTSPLKRTSNPDQKYVTEILLAAGILHNDLSIGSKCGFPVQNHHSSGQAIDPDLFYVLEQLKPQAHQPRPGSEKPRRKLVFDVVNEMLAQKLELIADGNRLQFLIQDRKINGQYLLQELCSDIDQLQVQSSNKSGSLHDDDISREGVLHQTAGWADFGTEKHEVVLEIERLIFKDLISDIIGDVTCSRQANCKAICLLRQ